MYYLLSLLAGMLISVMVVFNGGLNGRVGQTAALVILSGLLATALGGIVWNRALQVLGVARAALYAYWVPIFGVGFAVLLLGEPLSIWHGVGLVAVLGGTWIGTRGR